MSNKFWSEFIYKIKGVGHYWKTGVRQGLTNQIRYGHPEKKLKVICVGGTDGKTTSSSMIYHLLKKSGLQVGLISTVGAYIGDQELDTGFHVTAPGPRELYQLMDRMVKAGLEYLVLETTSQGMYQYRTWGIRPFIGALTNLDNDHLDYHVTAENYWRAKIKMLQNSQTVVLNADLPQLNFVKKLLPSSTKIVFFGDEEKFSRELEKTIKENFAEHYNQLNIRLALTVAHQLQLPEDKLIAALKSYKLPLGRMEFIKNNRDLTIIVDFAHTPQGLRNALPNVRRQHLRRGGKLISVFGCAGLRDYVKRPVMGRIGAEFSDLAIFTAEDPRSENVWSIINQMKSDLGTFHNRVVSIAHRADALDYALNVAAKPGDTIAVFGKGHEQSMNYGQGEELWNDIVELKKMLRQKPTKKST